MTLSISIYLSIGMAIGLLLLLGIRFFLDREEDENRAGDDDSLSNHVGDMVSMMGERNFFAFLFCLMALFWMPFLLAGFFKKWNIDS